MSHLHLLDSLTLDVFICAFVKSELFGWIAHGMFYFSVSKKCQLSIQIFSRSFRNIEEKMEKIHECRNWINIQIGSSKWVKSKNFLPMFLFYSKEYPSYGHTLLSWSLWIGSFALKSLISLELS
jgi:hypothetical protein